MTIIRKKHTDISYIPEKKICDNCGCAVNASDKNDAEIAEWEGFDSFSFDARHEVLFDSDMSYEIDLCRHCVVELFKPLLKFKYKKMLIEADKRQECECDNPILLGHEDVLSIPEGYARCQICRLLIKV